MPVVKINIPNYSWSPWGVRGEYEVKKILTSIWKVKYLSERVTHNKKGKRDNFEMRCSEHVHIHGSSFFRLCFSVVFMSGPSFIQSQLGSRRWKWLFPGENFKKKSFFVSMNRKIWYIVKFVGRPHLFHFNWQRMAALKYRWVRVNFVREFASNVYIIV